MNLPLPSLPGQAACLLALLAAGATGWLLVDDRPRLSARRVSRARAAEPGRSAPPGSLPKPISGSRDGPPRGSWDGRTGGSRDGPNGAHSAGSGRGAAHPAGAPAGVLACGLAGAAAAVLVGGVAGIVVGLVVAGFTRRLFARLEPAAARRLRRQRVAAELPLAADLLAACLVAGRPLPEAVAAVAGVLDGPLAGDLAEVTRRLRFGAEPALTWRALGDDPELAPLARAAARAAESGAALAEDLRRVADDSRRRRRAESAARAHRVAIRATAPLGLCFLPAFVLLGIVPLVAGITRTILGVIP